IRNLFAQLPEAKIRGYSPGSFSFNVVGGRCDTCLGAGLKIIQMNFLPDVHVHCETCGGQRYKREILEVRYRGKYISDVLNLIRNLFAQLPEAKIRGYSPGSFSFNVVGGRCDTCLGAGLKIIQMNFLPDVHVHCETCGGQRYKREILEVRYRGKSISDVLNLSIDEAVEFFSNLPAILHKIKTLKDVGLGYITLGQSSTTLSGGEAQRVKLATELSKKDTGNTFYILDEPTTGLHFEDVNVLLGVINRLVDRGNTVLLIEHNLDVIKVADWIIDMGPEGGRNGGKLIFSGTPEELVKQKNSETGRFLR